MTKEILIYTVGNAVSRGCSLLIFPMYAKKLSYKEFAIQDVALTFAAFSAILISLGIENGYSRLYHEKGENDKKNLATTWGVSSASVILIAAFLFYFLESPLYRWLTIDQEKENILLWALVGAMFQQLRAQPMMYLRMKGRPISFALIAITTACIQIVTVYWFVLHQGMGAAGVVYAYAVTAILALICAICISGWMWSGKFSTSLLKEMAAFGMPLLPAALATMGLMSYSRIILLQVSGEEQTALYGVSVRIASILGLMLYGFQMAWGPVAFKAMQDVSKAKILYEKASRYLALVGGIGVLSVSLISPELILILSKKEYLTSSENVPLMLLCGLSWSLYYIFCVGFQYAKKTYHQLISTIAGFLIMIVIAYLLIPKMGSMGAAVASLVGYVCACAYAQYASSMYMTICYKWSKLLTWLFMILGVSMLFTIFRPDEISITSGSYIMLILMKGGVVALAACIGWLSLLDERDKELLKAGIMVRLRSIRPN